MADRGLLPNEALTVTRDGPPEGLAGFHLHRPPPSKICGDSHARTSLLFNHRGHITVSAAELRRASPRYSSQVWPCPFRPRPRPPQHVQGGVVRKAAPHNRKKVKHCYNLSIYIHKNRQCHQGCIFLGFLLTLTDDILTIMNQTREPGISTEIRG